MDTDIKKEEDIKAEPKGIESPKYYCLQLMLGKKNVIII